MRNVFYRIFQKSLKYSSFFLPWRRPNLLVGDNSLKRLSEAMAKNNLSPIFIVTDKNISSLGLMTGLLNHFDNQNISYHIYDKTIPNPTIDNIEEALSLYTKNNYKAIVAFGGGSSIDCGKGLAARLARPNKTIPKMKGFFKVFKKTPLLFAIPTTAGTGSEATITAVITNSKTLEKYPINDLSLIPFCAVLDPSLTINLPPHITSTTGMDALTHAVEAYIGGSNTKETIKLSKTAIKLIFENIYTAYSDGENLNARRNMQKASFYAGMSFTKAYVGNVHAIAHTLGGFYSTPHGLANAVILPYVLKYYGKSVEKKLAELSDLVGISNPEDSISEKSLKFILAIEKLNIKMGIPNKIPEIKNEDIPVMIERALSEANPFYPVPKIFDKNDFYILYKIIKE